MLPLLIFVLSLSGHGDVDIWCNGPFVDGRCVLNLPTDGFHWINDDLMDCRSGECVPWPGHFRLPYAPTDAACEEPRP